MKAGTYLRLRREAAGLSIAAVAAGLSRTARWARFNAHLIEMTERGIHVPTPEFIDRLGAVFAFDRFVFRQLLCALEPAPAICLACGCSDLDACTDAIFGPCAWATPQRNLCTHCARLAGAHSEETDYAAHRHPA